MAVETSRGGGSQLSALAEGGEFQAEDLEQTPANDLGETEHSHAGIHKRLVGWIDNHNVARDLPADTLRQIGMLVCREYEIDENSRSEWLAEAKSALDFATQKSPPKQYPWSDASNIVFPLITTAAMRFNAMAYPAIVPSKNVVKGVIWGDDKGTPVTQTGKPDGAPKLDANQQPLWLIPPGEKARRAQKVGEHMSWQLLERMPYWEEQTDEMLLKLPIVGGVARKTYRNETEDCNASERVSLMNLVWNYDAPSFEKAPRHTELIDLYPHEIEELERADETFLPLVYGAGDQAPSSGGGEGGNPAPDPQDSEAPHRYLEQHRRYDLDGDGYAEPWIITVHERSASVVRMVAAFDEDSIQQNEKTKELKAIERIESYTLYRFLPNPKGGSYPCGFGHFLKPLNEAINTTLNQSFDAGHLQIAGGGFIGTGLSIHSGNQNFSIGEYKPVNNKGRDIRESIYTIPWPGPSPVLFEILGFLAGAAKEVASIQDVMTGDASMANTPPTTMVALVEQGMKVYTAIYKRIYRALKSELKKLYRLNRIYITEDERYRQGDTWQVVTAEDYRMGGGVEPVADPTMVTDMQRISRAAMIVDRAEKDPLVNKLEAEKYLFEAAQIPRPERFLPDQMPPPQPSLEQIRAQAEQAKGTLEQQRLQLEIQESQSKLGLTRAQELQAYTTAMLNFAKAKGEMSDGQIQFVQAQLDAMRLHIEALNTTVKAAQVDATIHGHDLAHRSDMMGHAVTHHNNMQQTAQRARELANEQPQPGRADDAGDGGSAPAVPEPANPGPDGSGIPAVAPQPDQSQLSSLPGA